MEQPGLFLHALSMRDQNTQTLEARLRCAKMPFALERESARGLSVQIGQSYSNPPSSKTRTLTEKHGGPDSLVMPRSSMRLEVETTCMHACNTNTNDDKSAINMRHFRQVS